jgi:DNA-binding transcriptional MerR regulator
MSPKAVAAATGVSTDTLRHYERLGLLPGVARTGAGYRRFPDSSVERVRMIQRALVVGFSLRELAGVLRERERGEPPCHRVRSLVGERLNDLERRIEELTALRADMRALLTEWDATLARTPRGQPARLLDMLTHRASLPGRTQRRVSRR